MSEPGEIEVAPAPRESAVALQNMLQLYVHDFCDYFADRPEVQLGDDGRFPPWPLEDYWRDPSRVPLLIRQGGRLAGFALLNGASVTGAPVDRVMAEFFIARNHRRRGAGRQAARSIFRAYPGVWELAVARRNLPALAFWRETIGGDATVNDLKEFDLSPPSWNGPVFRFRAGEPA